MIDPTRIIMDARFLRNSIFFSPAELKFVLQFPTLSDGAKCLWLFLAHLSAKDPDLTCALSLHEMAQGLGKSPEMISYYLSQLQHMGFLLALQLPIPKPILNSVEEIDEKRMYAITLPNAGLLELKAAILEELPSRKLFTKEDTAVLARHKQKLILNLLKPLRAS